MTLLVAHEVICQFLGRTLCELWAESEEERSLASIQNALDQEEFDKASFCKFAPSYLKETIASARHWVQQHYEDKKDIVEAAKN